MDWEEEYTRVAANGADAEPSFIDRARNTDDDIDVPRAILPFARPNIEETPLEQLMRHWMNERHAPDILPAQEELLTNLLDHLRRQVGMIIVYKRLPQ